MVKESEKKLLALLVVIVVLSLVVDLLSLNVLYNLSKSNADLEGELADVSPRAQKCINDECNTKRDCAVSGYGTYNDCFNENCVGPYGNNIEPEYDYITCKAQCKTEGDLEEEYCNTYSKICAGKCQDRYPKEPKDDRCPDEGCPYYYYNSRYA